MSSQLNTTLWFNWLDWHRSVLDRVPMFVEQILICSEKTSKIRTAKNTSILPVADFDLLFAHSFNLGATAFESCCNMEQSCGFIAASTRSSSLDPLP